MIDCSTRLSRASSERTVEGPHGTSTWSEIHLEPTGLLVAADQGEATDDSTVEAVREVVARRLGPDSCHDVRVIQGIEGRTVSLHCYLPGDATLAEALEIILRDRIGGIPIVDDDNVLCGIVT